MTDTATQMSVPRVLHVVGAMNVGGAETLLMSIYRRIDRSRLQFDFLVVGNSEGVFDSEISELGGRILRIPRVSPRLPRVSRRAIRKVIRTEGPFAAVHSHVLHASAFAVRAAKAEGIPVRVTHSHNTGDRPGGIARRGYWRWSRRQIVRKSTSLVACGREAGSYLFGSTEFWLLRNGVSLEHFRPPEDQLRHQVRAELGVPEGSLLIGSVARLEHVKNHQFLVEVASSLRSRGVEFRMVFVGDGSLREELETTVRARGLDRDVLFLGLRRDTDRLLSGFDALVMPSHYEGIPVALIEAQASALLCLVSSEVSDEVDLNLGLVKFLSIESPSLWASEIAELSQRDENLATLPDWEARVRRAGADINDSVELLYQVYGLEGS